MNVYNPELVWLDGKFVPDKSITVENGTITCIGDGDGSDKGAFLPGFVNAHSHAFQRGLRGLGETFKEGANTFWNWRDEMYNLVDSLTVDSFYNICVQTFAEMREAGITSVGEFHYLHHESNQDYAFDKVLLQAASEVGIRIVLLHACYMHGGFDTPISGGQERFATPNIDKWWDQIDMLLDHVDGSMQQIGTVAHSVRSVDVDTLVNISAGALHRGMPMHIHVEEQRQEIASCLEKHGKTPMALLNESLNVSPMMTAVHCTHSSASDLEQWISCGGNICLCPITEANLADGVCDLHRMFSQGGNISLGTDSNVRISMIEEMRWMEYGQRLAREERGVAIDATGQLAPSLINAATQHGARALGICTGTIEVGKYADFAIIDLNHTQLTGYTPESLSVAICCGTDNAIINRTIINGK